MITLNELKLIKLFLDSIELRNWNNTCNKIESIIKREIELLE